MKSVGILGAGRQAAETSDYLMEAGYKIEFFFVEDEFLDDSNPLKKYAPIVSEKSKLQGHKNTKVISAVGSPELRKRLVELWPYQNYFSFIHETAWVSKNAKIGKDVTIPPQCVVTTNAHIGDHVLLNTAVTINHDTQLEDYCTLSPGVHIAGVVKLGRGCFVGVGASVIDHVEIGEGTVIAARAVVTESVEDAVLVGGVPAKKLKDLKSWQA